MKRYMNDKTKGIIAILAAYFVFVLFSAMIDPIASAVIAIGVLSGIVIRKISNK
jgi:Co/Zn/Cd efflux system component